MALHQIVKEITANLEGTLACSILDLSSGMILAVHHTVPYFTQAYIDAVAATAVDLFRGHNIHALEKMLAIQRGESLEFHTKKVQFTSTSTYHFMMVIEEKPNMLLVLVTDKNVNTGLGWATVDQASHTISAILDQQ